MIGLALLPHAVFAAHLSGVASVLATVWSSGRPPECTLSGTHTESGVYNVWERAKAPELRRYCDLVAGATSKLAGSTAMVRAALDLAREADMVVPGHAAPKVLEGRALAALGQKDAALEALREGKARDPGVLDDPTTLLAWARAVAHGGHLDEAVDAYRALLPRATSLPATDRSSATVEAGLVAMAFGPAALDDAIGALREAARDAQDDAEGVAVLALALALDRRGDADEARSLIATRGHGDPRNLFEGARGKELAAAAPWEVPAIVAFALETTDAAGAHDAWEQYLQANPTGPWAAQVRARLLGPERVPNARRPVAHRKGP
jgi:tetratricopeptide (TPR) repeat protein